jgi:hypothetical protein
MIGRLRALLPLAALFAMVAGIVPLAPRDGAQVAHACAFADPPTTYEGQEDRSLYMAAMDLAG